MSDRRYSTSAWQQARKQILRRDGYVCRIQGPRCTVRATTVHHIIPSSQRPDLFFAASNLAAACGRCNYGDGSRIQSDNRRQRTEQLHDTIATQQATINELLERLDYYENPAEPAPAKKPPRAAIY